MDAHTHTHNVDTHSYSSVLDDVLLVYVVEAQGRFAVAAGNERVVGEAPEYRRLADTVLAAQYNLLLRHLDGRHVVARRRLRSLLAGHSARARLSFNEVNVNDVKTFFTARPSECFNSKPPAPPSASSVTTVTATIN